jgi:excisionase family DNA binding protein
MRFHENAERSLRPEEFVDERLLTAQEFASLLNVKISTVRAWLLARRISKIRVGRRSWLHRECGPEKVRVRVQHLREPPCRTPPP